jgi:hypothetical protein
MRRLLLTVVALGVAGMLAVPHAVAQAPTRDSVAGRLIADFGVRGAITYTIDVSSGPSGESPTGTIDAHIAVGPFDFHATSQATCLQVTGNRAVIGGRLIDPNIVFQVYLIVVDEPGDVQDRILPQLFSGRPGPATCAEFDAQMAGTTPPPAHSGSVVVVDAQPFPTSKEQCKNGGWRNFPGFKNQGACVSFVATGGKNTPAG